MSRKGLGACPRGNRPSVWPQITADTSRSDRPRRSPSSRTSTRWVRLLAERGGGLGAASGATGPDPARHRPASQPGRCAVRRPQAASAAGSMAWRGAHAAGCTSPSLLAREEQLLLRLALEVRLPVHVAPHIASHRRQAVREWRGAACLFIVGGWLQGARRGHYGHALTAATTTGGRVAPALEGVARPRHIGRRRTEEGDPQDAVPAVDYPRQGRRRARPDAEPRRPRPAQEGAQ